MCAISETHIFPIDERELREQRERSLQKTREEKSETHEEELIESLVAHRFIHRVCRISANIASKEVLKVIKVLAFGEQS